MKDGKVYKNTLGVEFCFEAIDCVSGTTGIDSTKNRADDEMMQLP
jgi:hypothetical protein